MVELMTEYTVDMPTPTIRAVSLAAAVFIMPRDMSSRNVFFMSALRRNFASCAGDIWIFVKYCITLQLL